MSNPYKSSNEKVVRFDLLSINKNTQKLCECKYPHFELDIKNRMVRCIDCGAILDSFEALCKFAEIIENYTEYQKEAIENINRYREMANKEFRRRFKNGVFKDMEQQYLAQDMLPECPHCGKNFDPLDLKRWTSRKYCDYKVQSTETREE